MKIEIAILDDNDCEIISKTLPFPYLGFQIDWGFAEKAIELTDYKITGLLIKSTIESKVGEK